MEYIECLDQCEWQKFKKGNFYCKFYKKNLQWDVKNKKCIVFRCKRCIVEDEISLTPDMEERKRIGKNLDMLQDSFYSFKDDFDEILSNIYRILKNSLEENNEKR